MTGRAEVLRLHDDDNVVVATCNIGSGAAFDSIHVAADIPSGHKIATRAIAAGEIVMKYGQPIGAATRDIAAGEHVHVHNVSAVASFAPAQESRRVSREALKTTAAFQGYRRAHGGVGTRNYVGIVATVNCSATVVRKIVERFPDSVMAAWPRVDGLVPITHTSGCGMPASGPGIDLLQRTLGGFIRHANFAGVLVVGLGCEVNEVGRLLEAQGLTAGSTLKTMTIQEAGGTHKAIAQAEATVRGLLELANDARREEIPAGELTLGLQCGGSDAYSGITANPALGHAADLLVGAGGTVILAETPEIYGAESLLLRRAADSSVADDLRRLIDWWLDHAKKNGASLDNNPSPGNVAGGLSTILEKSLGAVAKSGSSPLRGVYPYAGRIDKRGFVFMDSPGYDPCSATGEIAAGANIICFTTGRGSVFGAKPAPSIKLASNSEMAQRMSGDIDYDCGTILSGAETLAQCGEKIFQLILDTASGKKSASEKSGFGDLEFVPWQLGITL
ncbi:MAG TPA: altronate dehydratase family protein [Woeseiaceae bacterium]|nr:altronate dehydratase family protein [Woeseiaceae bacterium]